MLVSFDINTKYVAFALFDDDNSLKEYGRILSNQTLDARIGSVAEVVFDKFEGYHISEMVYENGYLANSPKILIELSKVTGSLIGGMWLAGVHKASAIPPITWQVGIGVGATSPTEMDKLFKKYPGRSAGWVKSKNRENRKQLIIDFVNKQYDLELTMKQNDEADAIALGHYFLNRGVK